MSKYFVRASVLLTIFLLADMVKGGDDSCDCNHNSVSHHRMLMPAETESIDDSDSCCCERQSCGCEGNVSFHGYHHGGYGYHHGGATYGLRSSSCGCSGLYSLNGRADYDVYGTHFGPGFYRHAELGHYRFPYYSYRRPWYFPGHAVYNRNTDLVW